MRPQDSNLRDALAAEYVLGTLHGGARLRFERWLRQDAALAAAVAAWEQRLHPLAERLQPVQPPGSVWEQIQRRTQTRRETGARSAPWWNSLALWRGFSAAAASVALVLAVLLVQPQQQNAHMVMVSNRQAQPLWMVSTAAQAERFTVKTLRPSGMPPEKVCVLWLIWPDGYTHPLTDLPERVGSIEVRLPQGMKRDPMNAEVAVSVEAAGKSSAVPSPDIVFRGPWLTL